MHQQYHVNQKEKGFFFALEMFLSFIIYLPKPKKQSEINQVTSMYFLSSYHSWQGIVLACLCVYPTTLQSALGQGLSSLHSQPLAEFVTSNKHLLNKTMG